MGGNNLDSTVKAVEDYYNYYYYDSALPNNFEIEIGHTLKPITQLTGYAVVMSITERRGITIMTDFGNLYTLNKTEILDHYEVTGFCADVLDRIDAQIQRLEKSKKILTTRRGV